MSHKPALRPDLAVGEALRAIAHDILPDARTAIESPDNSDAVAVHDFRREMKRWRALLRPSEPFLGDESEPADHARAIWRATSAARAIRSPRSTPSTISRITICRSRNARSRRCATASRRYGPPAR